MAPEKSPVLQVACLNCRKRHSKCSWTKPSEPSRIHEADASCDRCIALAETCIPGENTRFKHHSNELSPSDHQQWVKYPSRVRFIDETGDLEAIYNPDDNTSPALGFAFDSPTGVSHSSAPTPQPVEPTRQLHAVTHRGRRGTLPHNTLFTDARSLSSVPLGSRLGLYSDAGSLEGACFPLQSMQEARLMKYYLEYMCTWFDLCDASRHFALEVPRRAMSSPTLLNAIFALSSRHLSIMHEQFDEYASTRYHQNCLHKLSSISNDSSALNNDDLLAATILLRTLEELDVPLLGTDHEGHLLGIQVFMNAQDSTAVATEMRKAAYWIGLRQEVTMAFASQRSIKISLSHNFIDQSFSAGSDDVWANRIIVHCANVIEFSFGDGDQTASEYQALRDYDDGWLSSRPSSFLPIAYAPADTISGNVFPQIVYMNHAVVIGVAHGILARSLLLCYDPTLPKLGPARMIAQQRREEEVQDEIRQLCGIALSNRGTIPAMFTASLGIASCGDRFSRDDERMALLDLLIKTETDHFWPTADAQDTLKRAWGWV
ncbi:hypothetical protein B0J13DRAFT_508714 [Dactylonectria estremocensis]|uniref:Zn(2)-C6 fungal-type domain-containing protein n=1 Tax=Dactylonectria estremocensis TaxID=1079267 RepID=A0A9P9IQR2_9HYPO|nr:hypothetical protein B0J13DRAFT_508714 [Dactylonectria estremocensis]